MVVGLKPIQNNLFTMQYPHQFNIDFDQFPNGELIPTDTNIWQLALYHCNEHHFEKIIIPKNITHLLFFESDMEYLTIPLGIEYCDCSRMGLKVLMLLDGIDTVYCEHNCLKILHIPHSCTYMFADYNKLVSIMPQYLPNLREISLIDNRLKHIDLDCPELLEIDRDVGVTVSQKLREQFARKSREDYELFKC